MSLSTWDCHRVAEWALLSYWCAKFSGILSLNKTKSVYALYEYLAFSVELKTLCEPHAVPQVSCGYKRDLRSSSGGFKLTEQQLHNADASHSPESQKSFSHGRIQGRQCLISGKTNTRYNQLPARVFVFVFISILIGSRPSHTPFPETLPTWCTLPAAIIVIAMAKPNNKSNGSYTMKSLAKRMSSWSTPSGPISRSSFVSCDRDAPATYPWRRNFVTFNGIPKSSRRPSIPAHRQRRMDPILIHPTRMIPSDISIHL